MKAALDLPIDALCEICRRHGVRELSVFGSVLEDDFRPDSDVDFLVVFDSDDLGPWMGRLFDLQEELERLLGRKVDLVLKKNLKWVLRDRVLASAKVLYAAGNSTDQVCALASVFLCLESRSFS